MDAIRFVERSDSRGKLRSGVAWGVALLLVVSAGPVRAQGQATQPLKMSFKPSWLYSAETRKAAAGLQAELLYDHEAGRQRISEWQAGYDLGLRGAVTTESRFNPERLEASFQGGFVRRVTTGKVAEFTPGSVTPPEEDYTAIGAWDADASAHYQSDQRLEEQSFVASLGGGFTATTTEGAWRLLPSLHAYLDWNQPTRSRVRDQLDVKREAFGRFRFEASATLSLPETAPRWLLPFMVYADYRAVVLLGDLEVAALEDYEQVNYFAADLAYLLPHGAVPWARDLYIRYSHGALPPSADAGDAVRLGVTLAPGLGGKAAGVGG